MKMELTDAERWILMNQYKILALLESDRKGQYERAAEVISHGWSGLYSQVTDLPYEVDRSISHDEIYQILLMFSVLKESYEALEDQSGVNYALVEFKGFDGNNEIDHLNYAEFCINKLGWFAELKRAGYNTHHSTLARYRRMVQKYMKVAEGSPISGRTLTAQEINEIVQD
ncbi:MAG: YfbU family protein [Capsulimonadaceae bacterium]|nr:YfbU family protein [Capsulimonadaceae bacterium]